MLKILTNFNFLKHNILKHCFSSQSNLRTISNHHNNKKAQVGRRYTIYLRLLLIWDDWVAHKGFCALTYLGQKLVLKSETRSTERPLTTG